jgi:hypothetical protein
MAKLFGQVNQKIWPLAKKIDPLQNLITNAIITVFYTLLLLAKGTKNK